MFTLSRTKLLKRSLLALVSSIAIIAGAFIFDPPTRALVVALVMAVLSPVMALLGEKSKQNEAETDNA